ncbi:MAG TPA: hypothetical protein VM870_05565 [Pyrinomonadaceae bacterium]|jgi:hypothetical protein|nr:hypothetical protein [Pyrinomonadaceae bacterium]
MGQIYFSNSLCLTLIIALSTSSAFAAQSGGNSRTPTDTVREFYRALHEKRFRDAFALSIYKPAIEGLSPTEFADLNAEFEKIAVAIPDKFDILGEQISGDTATVFIRLNEDGVAPTNSGEKAEKPETVPLVRTGEGWIVGSKNDQQVVKDNGKDFFFIARIETHHGEVQSMMQRIHLAEVAYMSQHKGEYGDLAALIVAGLVPKDIEGSETTGYRFRVTLGGDAKTYTVGAEPAIYGRTGKLSYYMDQSGQLRSKDVKGKPLKP